MPTLLNSLEVATDSWRLSIAAWRICTATSLSSSPQSRALDPNDEVPEFVHDAGEFVNHPAVQVAGAVRVEQAAVVPEVVVRVLAVEPLPQCRAVFVVVPQHRARVVQLVGHRYQKRVLTNGAKVIDVSLLAL